VRLRHRFEFGLGLGEGNVEDRLPEPPTFEHVLEGERCLARAGATLDEVDPIGG